MAALVVVSRGKYATLDDALGARRWYENESVRQAALGLGGIALFFGLWTALTSFGLVSERFIPRPYAVALKFVELLADGTMVTQVLQTLWRVAAGFAIGAVAGVVVGFGMALSRYVRAAVYPLFAATFPLPKIALLPLSMIYLGMGDAPIVAVVAVSAFYLLPVNVMAAVGNIEPIYHDVAADLHVPRAMYRRTVAVPYALPMILAALRSAWAISLIVVVASEMLIGNAGIGYMIWQSGQFLQVDAMFSAFVAIGILGYASHVLFDLLTKVVTPWQPAP